MNIVIDTNIFISSLLDPTSKSPPALIVDAWLRSDLTLITSEEQIAELQRVSRYKHIKERVRNHKVGDMINFIRLSAKIVDLNSEISIESPDPDDNFLIAICETCYHDDPVDNLITGDHRSGLLQMGTIKGAKVLTASQFARLYLGWRG